MTMSKEYEILSNQILELKAENNKLRKIWHSDKDAQKLKAENDELKEEVNGLKQNLLEKENCSARYYLVTTHREWNELYKKFNYQREQKNKYKQCLDEIEEIAKNGVKDDCGMPLDELSIILNIIKQAKEGNNG